MRLQTTRLFDLLDNATADNGPAGLEAAHKAVKVFTGLQRRVTLRLPPEGFDDWNSALKALAAERQS